MQVVIIGNGIAGITAARTIRKMSDHAITVISSESDYFFSRTALMYVYMGHLRWKDILPYENWFWEKNNIKLVQDHVTHIDADQKSIKTSSGKSIPYDKLILATGSSSNTLDVPGKDLKAVAALYSRQDLEYIESKSSGIRRVVIVGGGLIGIELAEMFHSRGIAVTFLIREPGYLDTVLPYEESRMINRHILEHGIDLRLETEVKAILDNGSGSVKSVITNHDQEIDCDFVAIAIGVHPNVNWLKTSSLEIQKGILVDEYLRTTINDVYAIGDCAELRNPLPGRKSIEPFWYTGRMMGEAVAQTICNHPTSYQPGIWFNSAKFFDIEYQVYGDIRALPQKDQKTIFWKHSKEKKSIRINYTPEGVVGFNLLGVRFRQEVCEKWIRDSASLEEVIENFELAFFEPEFSGHYASEMRQRYFELTGQTVKPKAKMRYNQVYTFLRFAKKPTV